MKHARQYSRGSRVKSVVFFGLLICLMVFSLLLPLRPKVSLVEKRELATFPEFSSDALLRGAYFRGIDDWFSDTFPGKDIFVSIDTKIKGLYGFKTVEIVGNPGQSHQDDIPDTPFTGNK